MALVVELATGARPRRRCDGAPVFSEADPAPRGRCPCVFSQAIPGITTESIGSLKLEPADRHDHAETGELVAGSEAGA